LIYYAKQSTLSSKIYKDKHSTSPLLWIKPLDITLMRQN